MLLLLLLDRMMADLITGLLRRTGEAMVTQRPYGVADERRATAPLPPPVLPVRGTASGVLQISGNVADSR